MITVIGNLKGGAGKSTVAFNLAIWLAAHGKPVSAFDLDPQRTLSDVAEVRGEQGHAPLFVLHSGGVELIDTIRDTGGEVLVDIGTADMEALKGALSIADRVLIPVPPSQADIWSTQRFLALLGQQVGKRAPEVCTFVNRADTHRSIRESDEAAEALTELDDSILLAQRLSQRTAFRRSFTEGLGVFEMVPWSKASKEFKAFATALYPETRIEGE